MGKNTPRGNMWKTLGVLKTKALIPFFLLLLFLFFIVMVNEFIERVKFNHIRTQLLILYAKRNVELWWFLTHITSRFECRKYQGIFNGIMLVSPNIAMDTNNFMHVHETCKANVLNVGNIKNTHTHTHTH
jgi:hypothetical protein